MRKLLLVLAAACLAVLPMSASAATVFNSNDPIANLVYDPCSGQTLVFTGKMHLLISTTADAAGGFHLHVGINVDNLSAVSPTGVEYQGVGTFSLDTNVRPPYPSERTVNASLGFVSQGATPNFFFHEVTHITVNADGTLTSAFDKPTVSCNG